MTTLRTLLVLAFLTAGVAGAQTLPGTAKPAPGEITVWGRGSVTAPADTVRVSVQLFTGGGGSAGPALSFDDAANALRDALKSSGVADAHIVLPIGSLNARSIVPSIVGTVAKPTRERLEAIARDTVKAIPDRFAPLFANAQIQVALLVDDCGPEEARAERAAFEDAKKRAERIAADAGLRLGPVAGINASQAFLPPGCNAKAGDGSAAGSQNGYALGMQSGNVSGPYGPLELVVSVNETVSFSIVGP
jgi:uncharacterized protein YggE